MESLPRVSCPRKYGASLCLALLFVVSALTGIEGPFLQAAPEEVLGAAMVLTQVEAGDETGEARTRIVRVEPGGAVNVLTGGFHSARDPDVSFDGERILFSARRNPDDYWQIYEMKADGSDVRRITGEPMHCRQPFYQSYFYVITSDEPWPQIGFAGTPAGGPQNLFSTKLDGSELRQLTFNPYGVRDPYLMRDGRILVSSRQRHRIAPGPDDRAGIFGVSVDGADYAVFAADEGSPFKRMPAVSTGGLAVFVESDSPTSDGGWLSAVTLRRNLHSYRQLTEPGEWLYHSPSPLPDGMLLVSRRPAVSGDATYGVYRFDPATGGSERVHDSPDHHDIQARLLAPRPVPDGRSSVVNENDPSGQLYCLNVYTTDLPNPAWMPPGSAPRLRVVEGLPRLAERGGEAPPPARRVLGEIPVEADGSFNIRVPANIPIQLQLLDEHGMALRTCSWIWVKNHEPRGCIGCHEDGELVPENRLVTAVTKESVDLTLPPERRRRLTYNDDIRPIFQTRCASAACHGGGVPPEMSGNGPAHVSIEPTARTSPLVWSLFGRNTSRPWDDVAAPSGAIAPMPPEGSEPLTDHEIRTILEWIDLGAETQ